MCQIAQFLLNQPTAVSRLPHFDEGRVTVQDAHAQWSAELLDAQDGELILDACAAPWLAKLRIFWKKQPKAKVIALDY